MNLLNTNKEEKKSNNVTTNSVTTTTTADTLTSTALLNLTPHSLALACAQIIQLMLDMAVVPNGNNVNNDVVLGSNDDSNGVATNSNNGSNSMVSIDNNAYNVSMETTRTRDGTNDSVVLTTCTAADNVNVTKCCQPVSVTPPCSSQDKQFILRRTYSAPCPSSDDTDKNFQVLSVCPSVASPSSTRSSRVRDFNNDSCTKNTESSNGCVCSSSGGVSEHTEDMVVDTHTDGGNIGFPRTVSTQSPLLFAARSCSMDSHPSPLSLNVDCGSSGRGSPVSIGSPARRIMQIRREESVDEFTREAAKERDVTSVLNLSRSLDDFSSSLLDSSGGERRHHNLSSPSSSDTMNDKSSSSDVCLDSYMSIPSPVRLIEKFHHNRSLSPIGGVGAGGVPISPKQRTFRRSISPSSLRPSLLIPKRKLDTDHDRDGSPMLCTPAKRFYSSSSRMSGTFDSSMSSNASPDHDRVSDTSSNQYSGDDDSGSDHSFTPTRIGGSNTPSSLLTCDMALGGDTANVAVGTSSPNNNNSNNNNSNTSNNNNSNINNNSNSLLFGKFQYVAPPSPLAAGVVNNIVSHHHHHGGGGSRKRRLSGASYTVTTVTDDEDNAMS